MKKRIRKKLHLGEFAVYGFDFKVTLDTGDDIEAYNATADAIVDIIDRNGWLCGGAIEDMFICEEKCNSGIEDMKESFVEEVKALPHVVSAEASDMLDAWY